MEEIMIAKHLFGRTGHESTRAVFGGASLSNVTQDEADQTLEVLLRYGINHLDVAAGYAVAAKVSRAFFSRDQDRRPDLRRGETPDSSFAGADGCRARGSHPTP